MKKPKRPGEWQDFDVDSTEHASFDLGVDDEDEEIIELDDVLEIPEEATASGVEIADADSELDLKGIEVDFETDEEIFLEDDLGQFSFDEEKMRDTHLEQVADAPQDLFSEQEAELSLEHEEEALSPILTAPDQVKVDEGSLPEPELSAEEKQEKVSVDEFITQIEGRLLEALRQMVEARLPDIVRTVLREEIDRLKQELEKEKA
ncbi:MAG: hypothetical protein WCA08_25055 [Desulfoferrobacter sp.]